MPPEPDAFPDRLQQLDEVIALYLEAVELGPPPDQGEWLERYPQLADELRAFFADQDQFDTMVAPLRAAVTPPRRGLPGEPLTISLVATSPSAGSGPCRFGDYELLEEIARGGMGVVYRARQLRLNRTVALKMIRSGRFATPDEVQRFRLEAQAAAQLDHPNIVPIYEVGDHEGQHYFSMKLIEGGNLGQRRAVSGEPASSREAARLMVAVARAVHYAHLRGILHRDLKPANILVDAHGQPQVSDFGLARRLSAPVADTLHLGPRSPSQPAAPSLTQNGLAVGTPSYMAPEQAFGPAHALTTAADVYSLGAILYELLTGRPPFRSDNPLDTLVELMERQPTPPRTLERSVDRDLETICLKCLEKDPLRRYASAQALADDLQRYLDHEPINARPVGAVGRLWRGCRRRPVVAALSAALLLAVVAGVSLVTWHWRRAEVNFAESQAQRALAEQNFEEAREQREQAEINLRTAERHLREAEKQRARADESFRLAHRAVNDFTTRFSERDLRQLPALQPLRKELLQEALGYYQAFLRERGDDPALRAEMAATYFRIGAITSEIGSRAEALAAYQRALDLYREVHRAHPENRNVAIDLARTCNRVGIQQAAAGDPAALTTYQEARQRFARLAEREPSEPEHQTDLAAVCNNLANLYRGQGRIEDALSCYQEDTAILERLVAAHPREPEYRRQLATGYLNTGNLLGSLDRKSEEFALYQKAHQIQKQLVEAHPDNPSYLNQLGHSYRLIGTEQLVAGRPAEGLRTMRDGHALVERLTQTHPSILQYQSDLSHSFRQIGHAHRDLGQLDDALACYHRARQLLEKLVNLDPSTTDFANELGKSHYDIGNIHLRRGLRPEALGSFQRAVELHEKLVRVNPDHLGMRYDLAQALGNLGLVLAELNRCDEALAALRSASDHQRLVLERAPLTSSHARALRRHHGNLEQVRQRAERRAEVLHALEQRHMELEQALESEPDRAALVHSLAVSHRRIAQFQRESQRLELAIAAYRRSGAAFAQLAQREPEMPQHRHSLASSWFNQAMLLAKLNRREEESEAYQRARAVREDLLRSHPEHLDNRSDLGTVLNNWALTLWAQGRRDEAVAALRQAVVHQREALAQAPQAGHYRRGLSTHCSALADLLRQLGRPSEAAAVSRERLGLWPENAAELFRSACELAQAAEGAKGEERERIAADAVNALRQTVAAGYRDVPRLQTEPALTVLRAREDFQKLLKDLKN